MIDALSERLLTVTAAREWIRVRTGRAPGRQTVARWLTAGIGGVKLDSVLVGGRRMTSAAALQRFLHRENVPPVAIPSKRRQQEIEAADRRAREIFG